MEGRVLGDVVDEEDSYGRAVVGTSDRSEVLLASSVPYLQFDCFVAEGQDSGGELDPQSDFVFVVHALLHELGDDAALADARVTHYDELKQIIELAHY